MNKLAESILEGTLTESNIEPGVYLTYEITNDGAQFVRQSDSGHSALTRMMIATKWEKRSYERRDYGATGSSYHGPDGRTFVVMNASQEMKALIDQFAASAKQLIGHE